MAAMPPCRVCALSPARRLSASATATLGPCASWAVGFGAPPRITCPALKIRTVWVGFVHAEALGLSWARPSLGQSRCCLSVSHTDKKRERLPRKRTKKERKNKSSLHRTSMVKACSSKRIDERKKVCSTMINVGTSPYPVHAQHMEPW